MNPLVTIVIPTYSRPQHITRAIDSVLNQTYNNIEIIVVDDNGKNHPFQLETEIILKKYIEKNKINYIIHETNKNGSAARNTGLAHAKGKYIAFLDDDDIYLPQKVEKQVLFLENASTSIGGCICTTINIRKDKQGNIIEELKINTLSGKFADKMLIPYENVFIGTSKWLMRTSVCRELDGFDIRFQRHQDIEFLMRFFRKYELCSICPGMPLLKYDLTTESDHKISGVKILNVNRLFIETFKSDIDNFTNNKLCYHYLWLEPVPYLFKNKNIALAIKCIKKANEHIKLSSKQKKDYFIMTIKSIIKIIIFK